MKFLLIAGFPRSLVTFRGSLLRALRDADVEVHVASPGLNEDSASRKQLEDMGVKIHEIELQRTSINPIGDIQALLGLFKLMRKIKPDYVLGYTVKPVIYGVLAAWIARVPQRFALITGLGYAFQNNQRNGSRVLLRLLVEKLYAFTLRRTHLVFFQNPDDEALFRKLALLLENKRSIVVNGSGIPLDQFPVALLPREPRFLLIARLLGDKGIREYFEAAQRIKQRYPEVIFQLVGWIDENPDSISQEELNAWMSSGVIEYLGKLEDVRPAIEKSSVYVLPSYREGTPRTVLEAMAMGRAIITTDAPGCRETVINGENGFLVPVKSVKALASAMEEFISDPSLAVRMGQRSREIAVEKYDVHKVNAVMLREMGIK